MKLVWPEYGIQISLSDDKVASLVIENSKVYSECFYDLKNQTEGKEGEWILSDLDKEAKISKTAAVVFSPWSVDCNDKKIITRLYQEMINNAMESCPDSIAEWIGESLTLVEKMINTVPYPLEYDCDLDVATLLKICNVKYDMLESPLIERITSYVKAMHRICNVSVFVFFGINDFLEHIEVELLCKELLYEKVQVCFIERHCPAVLNDSEKRIVFDSDLCLIDYESPMN